MAEKRRCPGCGDSFSVNKNGRLRAHEGDAQADGGKCTQQARPYPSMIECACGKVWEGTPQDGHGATECIDLVAATVAALSYPAPTVEPMDDTTGTQCSEPRCTCGGDGGPGHELAAIGAFDDPDTPVPAEHQPGRPPAQAEVDYWQRQAREAAQRHFETSEGDTPYVALLKEELAEDPAPVAEIRIPGPMPTPDEFMDPAEPEVKLNVSGQPPARRDWQKRYIVVDPDLGDFRRTVKERKPKGITRATTFNKHAQNTTYLNLWGKANVARGASLRPDILRRAHGLTWEDNKDELLRIVDELETAAGAKVAADEGTFLHEFCDQVDAGLKTWQDAPPAYQQDIRRYVAALADAGLEPVPGLIERTTFIREYGGVAGTFDRIFYHRPSGQYIVGDLKTGKTMSYAMDETECQIWTYAHGVNQTGVYDWNTDTWVRPTPPDVLEQITVSETVGVIVHMPVQGPEAGEVYLRYADLECGRAYAELNQAVRSYPKSKVRPFEMPSAEPVAEPWQDIGGGVETRHSVVDVPTPVRPRNWHAEFRAVTSREQANALYAELKAHGANEEYLALARFFGKEALAGLASQSEGE